MSRTLALLALALAVGFAAWFVFGQAPQDGAEDPSPTPTGADARPAGPLLVGAGPALGGPGRALAGPTPPVPPAPPGSSAHSDEEGVELVGRVVDEARRGVAGATIVALQFGQPERRATTDATGAYRIAVRAPAGQGVLAAPLDQPLDPRRHGVAIRAFDGLGRAAQQLAPYRRPGARVLEVPWHVLKAAAGLRVSVSGPSGPLVGADVHVTGLMGFQPRLAAEALTDAAGVADPGPLPPGAYRVVAAAAGMGRGVREVSLVVGETQDVAVLLAAPRSLDVLVLSGAGEAPVAGATVQVLERVQAGPLPWVMGCEGLSELAPTGADGRTRIEGLGADPLALVVEAAGHEAGLVAWQASRQRAHTILFDGKPADSNVLRSAGIGPEVRQVTVVLRPLVQLRWPIKVGEVPTPPEGSVLGLEPDPRWIDAVLPATARVEGGFVVGEGWTDGSVNAFAIAADGSYARLFRQPPEPDGRETVFTRPRRLTVRVTTSEGKPAAGYYASVRTEGNIVIVQPTALDQDGMASWTVLHPYRVEVYVDATSEPYRGFMVGSADLRAGDGSVTGVVPAVREVVLHVTLDGRPGLPGEPTLTTVSGTSLAEVPIHAEDAEAGWLHARCALPTVPAPGELLPLTLAAPGFLRAQARLESVEADRIVARVDLARAGALRIRVLVAAGHRTERLAVLRRHPAPQGWQDAHAQGRSSRPLEATFAAGATEAVVTVPDLPIGAHRVAALDCLGLSPVVEVRAGQEVEVRLDLRMAGWVSGRVEAPAGIAVTGAEVSVDAPDIPPERLRSRWSPVQADGSFRVRVPGDRALPLRVRHPSLRQGATSEPVLVEQPRDGVVLTLEAAPSLSWTLAGGPSPAPRGPGSFGPRVLLFDDAQGHDLGTATIVHEGRAHREGDFCRIGGLPTGTFTLWIDAPWCAPLVRRRVVLSGGEVDLGALEPAPGTTLRVRFRVKAGEDVPRLNLWLEHEGSPSYVRMVGTMGGAQDLLLPGLGPGRFKLGLTSGQGATGPYNLHRTVEASGADEILIEVGPE